MRKLDFDSARARYRSAQPPKELQQRLASTLRAAQIDTARRRPRRWIPQAAVAAALVLFLGLGMGVLNSNPTLADEAAKIPVLGGLARILTFEHEDEQNEAYSLQVNIPGVAVQGDSPFANEINALIQREMNAVVQQQKQGAREYYEAWQATNEGEFEYHLVTINVDYEVKSIRGSQVSFMLTSWNDMGANGDIQHFFYNFDLEQQKLITLEDLLGPNYVEVANREIAQQIEQQKKDPQNSFFDDPDLGMPGFTTIGSDQEFYINEAGNPVVVFEKYEIAPGYMGALEYEIPRNNA